MMAGGGRSGAVEGGDREGGAEGGEDGEGGW